MSVAKESELTREKIELIEERIRIIYKQDSRPWVIGYSGGKDSSCLLQLTWSALAKMPKEELT